MFEGGEIQIVPSVPGSGDAFDVQTPAGRRRMRLMIDYLVVCCSPLAFSHSSPPNQLLARRVLMLFSGGSERRNERRKIAEKGPTPEPPGRGAVGSFLDRKVSE